MSTELFRSTRCFRDFLNDAKPKKTLVSDQTATCSLQPQENTQNHLKSSTIDLDASPLHLMPSSCSVVSSGLQIYRCLQQAFISWDKQIWSSVSGMGRLMEEQREGETGLICVYSIQYTVYSILYTVYCKYTWLQSAGQASLIKLCSSVLHPAQVPIHETMK